MHLLRYFFFPAMLRTPTSPLFPYTTLFRSLRESFVGTVVMDANDIGRNVLGSDVSTPHEQHVAADVVGVHHHRSEEHTSELQSRGHLVCRLLLEKKRYDK